MGKGATDRLALYGGFKNQGYDKPTRLQDGNVTTASVNNGEQWRRFLKQMRSLHNNK